MGNFKRVALTVIVVGLVGLTGGEGEAGECKANESGVERLDPIVGIDLNRVELTRVHLTSGPQSRRLTFEVPCEPIPDSFVVTLDESASQQIQDVTIAVRYGAPLEAYESDLFVASASSYGNKLATFEVADPGCKRVWHLIVFEEDGANYEIDDATLTVEAVYKK